MRCNVRRYVQCEQMKERTYYYDLVIGHLGKSSHVPTLRELFDVWEERWKSNTAFHKLENGDVIYQINDIRLDNAQSKATILISIIDRFLPDAAYGNLDTRETTVFKKGSVMGATFPLTW